MALQQMINSDPAHMIIKHIGVTMGYATCFKMGSEVAWYSLDFTLFQN